MVQPTDRQAKPGAARTLHSAAAVCLGVSIAFFLFFGLGKVSPFREINPFGEDPYDAVGSIAIQVALFASILSFARAIRLDPAGHEAGRATLVVRGSSLALAVSLVSLIVDWVAVLVAPPPSSPAGFALTAGLGLMSLVTAIGFVFLARTAAFLSPFQPPPDRTLADALDDLWSLVVACLTPLRRLLPGVVFTRLQRVHSDLVFAHLPWINPRIHPWRFLGIAGAMAGAILVLAQFREGMPPTPEAAVAVTAVFVTIELLTTLTGFAVLGGFLGLKPRRSVRT